MKHILKYSIITILLALFVVFVHDLNIWSVRSKQIDRYLDLRDIGLLDQVTMVIRIDSLCQSLKRKQWLFKDESLLQGKKDLICDRQLPYVDLGNPDLCYHYQVYIAQLKDNTYCLVRYGCKPTGNLFTESFDGKKFLKSESGNDSGALILKDTCLLKYLYFKSL